jgi:hypothetical protein
VSEREGRKKNLTSMYAMSVENVNGMIILCLLPFHVKLDWSFLWSIYTHSHPVHFLLKCSFSNWVYAPPKFDSNLLQIYFSLSLSLSHVHPSKIALYFFKWTFFFLSLSLFFIQSVSE